MNFINQFKVFKDQEYQNLESVFSKLEEGQNPHTLLVTCSDSRIVPSLIGQYGPGEVFVIRNAGNAIPKYQDDLDDSVAATIEYAIQVLKIKELIVCGHSNCGAVSAVYSDLPENLNLLNNYISNLSPLKHRCDENGPRAVKENVLMQVENLKAYPFMEDHPDVTIKGTYYDFANGSLEVLN